MLTSDWIKNRREHAVITNDRQNWEVAGNQHSRPDLLSLNNKNSNSLLLSTNITNIETGFSLKIVLAMAYFWPFELVWVFMLSVCRFSECLKRRDKFDMTFLTRYPTEILSLKFPFEIKFKTFQFKTTHWEHKTYKNAKYLWWYHKFSVSYFKFLRIKKLRRYRSFEFNPCRYFKI